MVVAEPEEDTVQHFRSRGYAADAFDIRSLDGAFPLLCPNEISGGSGGRGVCCRGYSRFIWSKYV